MSERKKEIETDLSIKKTLMEWKRRRKNIYFLIDSYSIKMEIPLNSKKPQKMMEEKRKREEEKFCFGI